MLPSPRPRRSVLAVLLLALAAALVAGCSSGDDGARPEEPARTPTPLPRATEPPAPREGSCYRLAFEDAVAFTNDDRPRGCRKAHTSRTFAVGRLDTLVDGHLVTVDSNRVKAQVAEGCPRLLGKHVGGSLADRRLSMLRSVWFTPTLEESDAGADWFRCDVIAVAADEELDTLDLDTEGVLGTPRGRDRYGMCGTAAPDARDFERVVCNREHSWRAVEVVTFESGKYPGERAAAQRGQEQCEQAGNERADDPLDFRWGYEWPTKVQWDAGIEYGLCWVPSEP